eukprot:TRINITY_DN63007_c0_g1_i1.p1 TRINITY_DN63007_c0_g1~~TRINITY_DN63007_c0_g1_i1.p1  ORF type:complete len:353 (-),score=99.00 TRINITY_DN63007_c0_g1_i1:8-1030(-)
MPRQGARSKKAAARRAATRFTANAIGAVPAADDDENAVSAAVGEAVARAAARPTSKRSRADAGAAETAADLEAAVRAPGDTAENLFELANLPAVSVSVGGFRVTVAQDRGATEHSGGVVWETALFLMRYLESQVLPKFSAMPRVLELGAGCGLLGLSLARLGCRVVLTEQPSALANLRSNVKAQRALMRGEDGACEGSARTMQLTWGDADDLAAVRAKGPFDLVVASDVVFAKALVDPLLRTIAALLPGVDGAGDDDDAKETSGCTGTCWLCLQQRDPDAHAALLEQAPRLFRLRELSFAGLEGFEAAQELDCLLLRLRPHSRPREGPPRKRRRAEASSG